MGFTSIVRREDKSILAEYRYYQKLKESSSKEHYLLYILIADGIIL